VRFLVTVAGLLMVQIAAAKAYDKSAEIAGLTVHYKLILPKAYDETKAYPAVIAFPPGAQTMDMVLTTQERNWRGEAERRGYIVVIPAAPGGHLFFEEGARVFPQFIEMLRRQYKIDGKLAIAGMSNGGLSAFHIAASYPQYFSTLIGFPGYLPDATPARVDALSKMCIDMHAGALDSGWREEMRMQFEWLRSKGYKISFTVEPGEGHVIGALTGAGAARLFDEIEKGRQNCGE